MFGDVSPTTRRSFIVAASHGHRLFIRVLVPLGPSLKVETPTACPVGSLAVVSSILGRTTAVPLPACLFADVPGPAPLSTSSLSPPPSPPCFRFLFPACCSVANRGQSIACLLWCCVTSSCDAPWSRQCLHRAVMPGLIGGNAFAPPRVRRAVETVTCSFASSPLPSPSFMCSARSSWAVQLSSWRARFLHAAWHRVPPAEEHQITSLHFAHSWYFSSSTLSW